METSTSLSPLMPMFEKFRDELDEHHDRRERIIKASRDITALSKKMQDVRKLKSPIPANVAKENTTRQETIDGLFKSINKDLQGMNAWRYQRQISGGIQEYMEAVTFQHYLEVQRLMTYNEAQMKLPEGMLLTHDDYLLGIYDMTGELMRFAITNMAMSGEIPGSNQTDSGQDTKASAGAHNIVVDMRSLRSHLECLNTNRSNVHRDVSKKMEVMKVSVEKVESAVYGMIVRGTERPKGWMPDSGGDSRAADTIESC